MRLEKKEEEEEKLTLNRLSEAPSPPLLTHHARLMTECRAGVTAPERLRMMRNVKKTTKICESARHTHTETLAHTSADRSCCHGNPVPQLSSAHQFPQQHKKVGTITSDIMQLRGQNGRLMGSDDGDDVPRRPCWRSSSEGRRRPGFSTLNSPN